MPNNKIVPAGPETTDTHDASVVEALSTGVIWLLSCEWLRAQADVSGFRLPRRQELPAEAVLAAAAATFASQQRRVAVLSYGCLAGIESVAQCWLVRGSDAVFVPYTVAEVSFEPVSGG